MLRRYSVNFELFSILLDATTIMASLSLAVLGCRWLANNPLFINYINAHELPGNNYYLFPAIWIFINLTLNLYDGRRNVRFKDEISRLVLSVFFATVGLAGLLFLITQNMIIRYM